jgi:hypothetical protein
MRQVAPDLPLNSRFIEVVRRGMGKVSSANPAPVAERSIVDAFQHARFFLELAISGGREHAAAPKVPSTGWATLVHLYSLR